MIVFVTGTNGAGKTTLMRRIMELLPGEATDITNTEKPMGKAWPGISVIGRYKGACGGCDRLSWKGASDDMEQLVAEEARRGQHVLLEGLIVSNWGIDRIRRLNEEFGVVCVHLDVPLEKCIDSVNDRRKTKALETGKEFKPTPTHNISGKFRTLVNNNRRRKELGIPVVERDREAAFAYVKELLCI